MKTGDLVRYIVEDSICFDDPAPPKIGIVIMCKGNTADVLTGGMIDRMIPMDWLEVIDETR